MTLQSMGSENIQIQDQYSDFLIRAVDPYAQAKYAILHKALDTVRGLSCLVIGAGSGEFACELAKHGAIVTAVDIDQTSISLCQQNAKLYGVEMSYIISDIESLSIKEQFDRVVATDVIEHVKDDKTAVEKIFSLTKVGGKIVVTVPALNILFGHHDVILGHFRRYTCPSLQKLFALNCETLMLRYFGFFLIPVTLIFSVLLKKPYPVASVGKQMGNKSLMSCVLGFILEFEKRWSLPLGTSVLAIFRKPGNSE